MLKVDIQHSSSRPEWRDLEPREHGISPLRCATVEMTVVAGTFRHLDRSSRHLDQEIRHLDRSGEISLSTSAAPLQ